MAPVVAGSAAADVIWETSVRITDKLGRGTAEIEETITTSVAPAGRREEVAGSRRMTTRRGRQYERPGRRGTIDRLEEGGAYDMDLGAGTYTKATFAELARERERTLVEAYDHKQSANPIICCGPNNRGVAVAYGKASWPPSTPTWSRSTSGRARSCGTPRSTIPPPATA